MVDIYGKTLECTINGDRPAATFRGGNTEISFWGRIYNTDALQPYAAANDALTVFNIYADGGLEALSRIDGRFLVIITSPDGIAIVRDRHGIFAQLYYTASDFATDLHRLCQAAGGFTPDAEPIATFLATGIIPTPKSAFRDVSKLPAGSALVINRDGRQAIKRLPHAASDALQIPGDERQLVELYGRLHTDAIKRRTGDNHTVGILLSGGYDSGSNLAALRQCHTGEIRSYSIGFRGDNWTELPLARIMSQRFGTVHTEYEITGEEILHLPEIVCTIGDPFVEGGLMVNHAAMRLAAADRLPVIIGGDGSDQYFGTAGRELALMSLSSRYGLLPMMRLAKSALEHDFTGNNTFLYKVYFRLLSICDALDGELFGFGPWELKHMFPGLPPVKHSPVKPASMDWETLYRLHRQHVDIERTVDQVILFKASRMADMMGNLMAFPFTDLNLLSLLDRVPVQLLCRGASVKEIAKGNCTAKYLLKARYKPLLPPEITSKKKQGGFAPMPIFFDDDNRRRLLADFILSSSMCREIADRSRVEKFITRYDAMCHDTSRWFWFRQNEAIKYFSLLSLAAWWEIFVKGKSVTL